MTGYTLPLERYTIESLSSIVTNSHKKKESSPFQESLTKRFLHPEPVRKVSLSNEVTIDYL